MNDNYRTISSEIRQAGATLVAVSKTKPIAAIEEMYQAGQRDFGENRVQELEEKAGLLPDDIRWHQIGHLQKNKVKYIAPYVHLIHSVDSLELLAEINKQALKHQRVIACLLQIHIAEEDTKFGMDRHELEYLLDSERFTAMENIRIDGLMGLATFTEDQSRIRSEFHGLKNLFDETKKRYFSNSASFRILSMGMSSDYRIALEEGSNMVRIGTLLFGSR